MTAEIQIIERDGQPEYAVVPFDMWQRVVEQAEQSSDEVAYDRAMAELADGSDEAIPREVAERLLAGKTHPVRVWREYRGLTQEALAAVAGVGKSYISQLESGRKSGSMRVMRLIAGGLSVEIEDLLPSA
jgi:DNA-binding XRE family transcriptional regulator